MRTKKFSNIKSIIFPAKKINIVVISVILLGVVGGAVFASVVGLEDRTLIIDKIKQFIDNINLNNLDNLVAFKNSITTNSIYIGLIWILGMTVVGVLFNMFLLFIKGFILGFSAAAFILTYGYKGIILSSLYVILGQVINVLVIMTLTIYSIMFTVKLLELIFRGNNNVNMKRLIKHYVIILFIVVGVSLLASLSESFLLPSMIKLIVKGFL